MIKFNVISENRSNDSFCGEAGLSVVIEVNDYKFLLDTGYTDLYTVNASKLNINLEEIKDVIITHGHADHSGGIPYLPNKKRIIMHPSCYKNRWSIRRKIPMGFVISENDLVKRHEVITSVQPIEFNDNIYFLGEIPMIVEHERNGNFSTMLDEDLKEIDYTEDDTGIAIKTEKGLVVVTGCGHRGICNTIEHAKKITGENRIYAAFGGFHLRYLDKQKEMIDNTIEYFKRNDVKVLFLGHCVTDEVINYFKDKLNDIEIINIYSGGVFELN